MGILADNFFFQVFAQRQQSWSYFKYLVSNNELKKQQKLLLLINQVTGNIFVTKDGTDGKTEKFNIISPRFTRDNIDGKFQ